MIDKLSECIKDKSIAIIGAGGLGGNIISLVARLNPKKIQIFDGDTFCASNLNRQLFCTDKTLGLNKAVCAKNAISDYARAEVIATSEHLTKENSFMLSGFDIIIDATDNLEVRYLLQSVCNKYKVPIIHGAINGLFGQVAVLTPESELLSMLNANKTAVPSGVTLSYVPALIASVQVSEMVKLMAGISTLKCDQLIIIDLLTNDARIITL
jgi:molybdopterin/thiamine biosynthesis adenylyltransferase